MDYRAWPAAHLPRSAASPQADPTTGNFWKHSLQSLLESSFPFSTHQDNGPNGLALPAKLCSQNVLGDIWNKDNERCQIKQIPKRGGGFSRAETKEHDTYLGNWNSFQDG